MIVNPEFKPYRELGQSDAQWTALKATVISFLKANADKPKISEESVRRLDPRLSDDRIWAQLAADLQLISGGR